VESPSRSSQQRRVAFQPIFEINAAICSNEAMYPMLREAQMSANAGEAKTFNNCLSFERGLWQRKNDSFSDVPKTSVFERRVMAVERTRIQFVACAELQRFKSEADNRNN